MFSSNQEFYKYIEALIEKLVNINEKEWGAALKDALAISSLPGEVLGKIWLTLKEFQTTNIPDNLGIRDEIEDVINSLRIILGN